MSSEELHKLACDLGLEVSTTRASQTELVRFIQALRGEEPCFSTDKRYNCEEICDWRQNCRKPRTVWLH